MKNDIFLWNILFFVLKYLCFCSISLEVLKQCSLNLAPQLFITKETKKTVSVFPALNCVLVSLHCRRYFGAERLIINRVFDAAIVDAWLVQDWSRDEVGVRGGTKIFIIFSIFPSPPPWPNFPLNAYSLGKYFLTPSLQSYQIQDGDLNTKMCTRASKIRLHRRLCPGELSKVSVHKTTLR